MISTMANYSQCINGYMNKSDGYIRVKNKGLYIAVAEVRFYVNDKLKIYRSSKLVKGKGAEVDIPKKALQITLDTYYYSGTKYIPICTKFFDDPIKVCYELIGTAFSPQCNQVVCGSNNGGNGSTTCCCCCCTQ
ncbi:hypothetical protein [Clostridium botulinum]|uniref:hypothetical protein n=1 Tax=Clostridium botulinum TaxID=1491 RepID=UPI000A4ECAC7|nr:hypothetical protein [Clostridium botulinum]